MMNDILYYIQEEALALMPALFVIGLLLKNSPKVADWTIPWILLACGIAGGIFLLQSPFEGILQGILVTGATVLTHQLIKQTNDR
jgi:type III secretory pathway component EscR